MELKWRILEFLIVISLLGFLLSGCAGLPFGAQLMVHPGETIQDVVNQAQPGWMIYVPPGTYPGDVTVDKDGITLKGEGTPVIDGNLIVTGDDVTIDGFEVTGGLETVPGSFENLTFIETIIWGITLNITISCDAVVNPSEVIQDAIAAATAGDTICVAPGTYNEQLTVDKNLTIKGLFNPVLDLTGYVQYGIWITAANVAIDGLVVENLTQLVAPGPAGILIDHADDVVVKNCTIRNNSALGILVWESDGAQLLNNTAYNNTQWTYAGTPHAASGISVTMDPGAEGPIGAIVSGNVIYNNEGWGIGLGCGACDPTNPPLSKASGLKVIGNIVYGNWYTGIGMAYVDNSEVSSNTIHDNGQMALSQYGYSFAFDIGLYESDGNLIEDNDIYGSKDSGAALRGGIGILSSDDNTVEGNDIHNEMGTGIALGDTTGTEVHYNNIYNNDYGLKNDVSPTETVDAENNWWGDPTGPYHPTLNPAGLGDEVSDNVDFEPWLTAPI